MTSPEMIGQQLQYARPVYSGPGIANSTGSQSNSWEHFALSNRPAEATKDEPAQVWAKGPGKENRNGMDRYTAMVPVSQLTKYTHFDRNSEDDEATTNALAQTLKTQGIAGLHNALELSYDRENDWGVLAEGHHRLKAAIRAGITHVPVMVTTRSGWADVYRKKGFGAPLHMDRRVQEQGDRGYHPAYVHPGNFQEFEGAR